MSLDVDSGEDRSRGIIVYKCHPRRILVPIDSLSKCRGKNFQGLSLTFAFHKLLGVQPNLSVKPEKGSKRDVVDKILKYGDIKEKFFRVMST